MMLLEDLLYLHNSLNFVAWPIMLKLLAVWLFKKMFADCLLSINCRNLICDSLRNE